MVTACGLVLQHIVHGKVAEKAVVRSNKHGSTDLVYFCFLHSLKTSPPKGQNQACNMYCPTLCSQCSPIRSDQRQTICTYLIVVASKKNNSVCHQSMWYVWGSRLRFAPRAVWFCLFCVNVVTCQHTFLPFLWLKIDARNETPDVLDSFLTSFHRTGNAW